jgi:hypothetical protein
MIKNKPTRRTPRSHWHKSSDAETYALCMKIWNISEIKVCIRKAGQQRDEWMGVTTLAGNDVPTWDSLIAFLKDETKSGTSSYWWSLLRHGFVVLTQGVLMISRGSDGGKDTTCIGFDPWYFPNGYVFPWDRVELTEDTILRWKEALRSIYIQTGAHDPSCSCGVCNVLSSIPSYDRPDGLEGLSRWK